MNEIIIKKNEMITKKKKKGFTLIELIAVIAILAILGAILVPKITGYSDSAKKAKAISDAKIIVNAVSAYNADNETAQIADTANFAGMAAVVASGKTIESRPTEFDAATTLATLKLIAENGKSHVHIASGMATYVVTPE